RHGKQFVHVMCRKSTVASLLDEIAVSRARWNRCAWCCIRANTVGVRDRSDSVLKVDKGICSCGETATARPYPETGYRFPSLFRTHRHRRAVYGASLKATLAALPYRTPR